MYAKILGFAENLWYGGGQFRKIYCEVRLSDVRKGIITKKNIIYLTTTLKRANWLENSKTSF